MLCCPAPSPLRCFEMVARRDTKILQPSARMQVEQLAPRHAFDCLKPEHGPIFEPRLSVAASKRPDQDPFYDVPGIPSTRMVSGPGKRGPGPSCCILHAWGIREQRAPSFVTNRSLPPLACAGHIRYSSMNGGFTR